MHSSLCCLQGKFNYGVSRVSEFFYSCNAKINVLQYFHLGNVRRNDEENGVSIEAEGQAIELHDRKDNRTTLKKVDERPDHNDE